MNLGLVLRNMGPASAAPVLFETARHADRSPLDAIWVTDHVAIPPDDAEGSGGRYLDPLSTLAALAGVTRRIRLGTAVLVAPYRPPLPTAKALATIQELSGGRLVFGAASGWMEPEFRALGVPFRERGRRTDATLDLVRRAFDAADDVVTENGQPFLFRPRPARPPILVGGGPKAAFPRAARYGDGWLPMGLPPEKLADPVAELRRAFAGRTRPPEVVVMTSLPLDDPPKAGERIEAYAEAGATGIIHGGRYETERDAIQIVDALAALA